MVTVALPDVVLAEVFSFLPPRDRIRSSLVDSRWMFGAKSYRAWSDIKQAKFDNNLTSDDWVHFNHPLGHLIVICKYARKCLKGVSVTFYNKRDDGGPLLPMDFQLSVYCPNVKCLIIDADSMPKIAESDLRALITGLNKVEDFMLYVGSADDLFTDLNNQGESLAPMGSFSQLCRLRLHCKTFEQGLRFAVQLCYGGLPKLQALEILGLEGAPKSSFDASALTYNLRNASSLRELSIGLFRDHNVFCTGHLAALLEVLPSFSKLELLILGTNCVVCTVFSWILVCCDLMKKR